MTVSGHANLELVDTITGRTAKLDALAHRPAVRRVARGDETTTYVAVGLQHDAASIGLGCRTWPWSRLEDLIRTLMLAIMTDHQQHTLLTRFIPVRPGDAELDAKIHSILTDVDLVLPAAVALLADERCGRNQPE